MEIGDNLFLILLFVLILIFYPVKKSTNSDKKESFTTQMPQDSMVVINRKFLSKKQDSILMDAIEKIKINE